MFSGYLQINIWKVLFIKVIVSFVVNLTKTIAIHVERGWKQDKFFKNQLPPQTGGKNSLKTPRLPKIMQYLPELTNCCKIRVSYVHISDNIRNSKLKSEIEVSPSTSRTIWISHTDWSIISSMSFTSTSIVSQTTDKFFNE